VWSGRKDWGNIKVLTFPTHTLFTTGGAGEANWAETASRLYLEQVIDAHCRTCQATKRDATCKFSTCTHKHTRTHTTALTVRRLRHFASMLTWPCMQGAPASFSPPVSGEEVISPAIDPEVYAKAQPTITRAPRCSLLRRPSRCPCVPVVVGTHCMCVLLLFFFHRCLHPSMPCTAALEARPRAEKGLCPPHQHVISESRHVMVYTKCAMVVWLHE
jgi:hypothetical protein